MNPINPYHLVTIKVPDHSERLSGFVSGSNERGLEILFERDGRIEIITKEPDQSVYEFMETWLVRPAKGSISAFLAQQMAKDRHPMPEVGAMVSVSLDNGTTLVGRVQSRGRPMDILCNANGDVIHAPHWLLKEIDLPETEPGLDDWSVLSLTVRPGAKDRLFATIGFKGEPVIGVYGLAGEPESFELGCLREASGELKSLDSQHPVLWLSALLEVVTGLEVNLIPHWILWDWFCRPFDESLKQYLTRTIDPSSKAEPRLDSPCH